MILQLKVYFIGFLYLLGCLYMYAYPPRNFKICGGKLQPPRLGPAPPRRYLSYDELLQAAGSMAAEAAELVTLVHLEPSTVQNRSLIALELRSDRLSRKPGILVVGALDGMAWAAVNTIMELADNLIRNPIYQTPFFNDYDWYLIPLGNPDGLNLTQSVAGLPPLPAEQWARARRAAHRPSEWHKNCEREDAQVDCFGTHVNRNFAYHWQDDVRKTPPHCAQLYPGHKPFSTREARALRGYVDRLADAVQLTVHLHASFVPKKELLLYPWRYTTRRASNAKELQAIGEYAARHALMTDGRLFEVRQGSVEERVAGSFVDYVAGVAGADLVYLLKPYHQLYPPANDTAGLDAFVKKSTDAILGLASGWRSHTRLNTLSFFGRDVEF